MLHIVSGYSKNSNPWSNCIEVLQKNDSIVFVTDGVEVALSQSFKASLRVLESLDIDLFVLSEDLEARAIRQGQLSFDTISIAPISIEDFAKIVAGHSKSLTWY